MNYAKERGTRAESALCDYLHAVTGAEVMRRTMHGGGNDRGDLNVVGVPLMAECKNTKRANLSRWAVEVDRQCVNLGAPYGVLIWSPPGLGPKSIERWIAIEWAETALTPFSNHGMIFTGPTTRLAAVVADYAAHGPIMMQDEAEGVMRVRCRFLHQWTVDLQEHLARTV